MLKQGPFTLCKKTNPWDSLVCKMAETVGFEPTDPCGSNDFEGRETAKTALYFHISSYRLSAKSLVNKGFSCIL